MPCHAMLLVVVVIVVAAGVMSFGLCTLVTLPSMVARRACSRESSTNFTKSVLDWRLACSPRQTRL